MAQSLFNQLNDPGEIMKTFKAMLDRTNMDTLYALKKYPRKKKKRANLNMPARKEILKNCRQVIFHVFKHDLDEVGHFCKNRWSLKCFIEGMRTCLGLKRLLKYPREHTLSNKRSVNSIEKVERKLPWKWSQVVFRKPSAFFSKDYDCLPLRIALFLLPLVFK